MNREPIPPRVLAASILAFVIAFVITAGVVLGVTGILWLLGVGK